MLVQSRSIRTTTIIISLTRGDSSDKRRRRAYPEETHTMLTAKLANQAYLNINKKDHWIIAMYICNVKFYIRESIIIGLHSRDLEISQISNNYRTCLSCNWLNKSNSYWSLKYHTKLFLFWRHILKGILFMTYIYWRHSRTFITMHECFSKGICTNDKSW